MDMTAITVALISLFGMIWQSYHNGKMIKKNDLKKEMEELKKDMEGLNGKIDTITKSQMHTLQERLLNLCKQYLQRGSITVNELKLITNLYSSYHNLGGNDFITQLFERVKRLPIKEDDD